MNRLYLLCCLVLFLKACGGPEKGSFKKLEGETMGTYYAITYKDNTGRDFKPAIDSLLMEVNQGLSTYIPSSSISLFNQATDTFILSANNTESVNQHFLANFKTAKAIFDRSQGAFDPTVMPLVNYWGFGYTGKQPITAVDSLKIDSLIQLVGFDKIELLEDNPAKMVKFAPGVQLDMSGCAKGYGVDQIGIFLEQQLISDYLVDIGGEIRVKGKNAKGTDWKIGINVPKEDAGMNEIQEAVPVTDISVATSGNYRNFYEVNGVKYSHTINPNTGFPERNTLLSASVFTADCVVADAYATAFMVMGIDKALALAEQITGLEAYFIYSQDNGEMAVTYTKGLEERVLVK